MTVTIRPEQPGDRVAVRRVVGGAFVDEPEVVDLVERLRDTGSAQLGLVAEEGGVVVGHVLLSRSWVDAETALVEVLVLGPLAVAPERQGRGTGSALVEAAVAAAGDRGAPALFLEGDPGFYGARGFARAVDHGFDRPSERIPQAAFQVALLPGYEPWMSGRLVYCEPFWALDCVGLRGETLARVRSALGD